MANSYIPRTDIGALDWMRVFAGGISAHSWTYSISPVEAATIQRAVDTYAAAFAVAINEATRTKVTICDKDQTRNAAEQICRQYYSLIKPNAGVSDSDKIAIGVRPPNPGRMRINCPHTSPQLSIIAATPGAQTLRYKDSLSEGMGKPFGAIGLQLLLVVGDAKVTSAEDARFYGTFTRNPVGVSFKHDADGKIATYFARWTSRRGDVGPWSLPVSMRIAA